MKKKTTKEQKKQNEKTLVRDSRKITVSVRRKSKSTHNLVARVLISRV